MRILITGQNSYIGTSFENYMRNFPDMVDTVDTLSDAWKKVDYSLYDTVFHVAGLTKVNPKIDMKNMYYEVNHKFALEVAKTAKEKGARGFIFMSSIMVYGKDWGEITADTVPAPVGLYGDSKLKAEQGLEELSDENFKVTIVRTPMIYGPNSKANFAKLSKLSKISVFFPNVKNKRSMLYIDNLCECIRLIAQHRDSGIIMPQNKEYVNTADLVCRMRQCHNKSTIYINIFNPIIRALSRKINTLGKMFGDLYYSKELSAYRNFEYCIKDFDESVIESERGKFK